MNDDYARQQMVDQQVRAWDVLDPKVLDAMRAVPRERFVPERFREMAYSEAEIPIGNDQWMMSPSHEGRLIQALELTGDERVLEVGTGTGYVTACLAQLARDVVSVDIYDDFTRAARQRLTDLQVENVECQTLDATKSLPEGPFDAIAVTGSLEKLDTRFVDVLANDGRLFIVTGDAPAMEARRIVKRGENNWESSVLFETRLKRLVNGTPVPEFVF